MKALYFNTQDIFKKNNAHLALKAQMYYLLLVTAMKIFDVQIKHQNWLT